MTQPIGFSFLGYAASTAVICLVSALSALTAKETFKTPTRELGLK